MKKEKSKKIKVVRPFTLVELLLKTSGSGQHSGVCDIVETTVRNSRLTLTAEIDNIHRLSFEYLSDRDSDFFKSVLFDYGFIAYEEPKYMPGSVFEHNETGNRVFLCYENMSNVVNSGKPRAFLIDLKTHIEVSVGLSNSIYFKINEEDSPETGFEIPEFFSDNYTFLPDAEVVPINSPAVVVIEEKGVDPVKFASIRKVVEAIQSAEDGSNIEIKVTAPGSVHKVGVDVSFDLGEGPPVTVEEMDDFNIQREILKSYLKVEKPTCLNCGNIGCREDHEPCPIWRPEDPVKDLHDKKWDSCDDCGVRTICAARNPYRHRNCSGREREDKT